MKKYYFIIYLLIIFGCTKEEVQNREYPRVRTKEVTSITSSGLTFQADVTIFSGKIIDHGFVWSTSASPSLQEGDRVSLGALNEGGSFSSIIERTLLTSQTYYVKGYVKTGRYLVYGEAVAFKSLGGKAPVITTFEPLTGVRKDTITIHGKNFTYKSSDIGVSFGEIGSTVFYATDTLIKTVVPLGLTASSSKISVSILGNKGVSSQDFTLLKPQLLTVDKTDFNMCDTLKFTGIRLPPTGMNILFNDKPATIISNVNNILRVKAPAVGITNIATTVTLKYEGLESIFSEKLNYQVPAYSGFSPSAANFLDTLTIFMDKIPVCGLIVKVNDVALNLYKKTKTSFKIVIPTNVTTATTPVKIYLETNLLSEISIPRTIEMTSVTPSSGTFDDVIKIKGKGFHPDPSRNIVCFNCSVTANSAAEVIASTPTELTVKVPRKYVAPANGISSVGVTTMANKAEMANAFQLNAPIVNSYSPSVVSNGTVFTVTGQNFNPDPTYNIVVPVGSQKSYTTVSATSTQLTLSVVVDKLMAANSNMSSEFDTQLNVTVSGQSVNNGQSVHVLYKGPWTKKADFPGEARTKAMQFAVSGKVYYGMGKGTLSNTIYQDFWEYDPAADVWQQLADFPGPPRSGCSSWNIGNTAYLAFGSNTTNTLLKDVWQFDGATKVWTQRTNASGVPPTNGSAAVSFNTPYLVTGNSISSYNVSTAFFSSLLNAGGQVIDVGSSTISLYFLVNVSGTIKLMKLDTPSSFSTTNAVPPAGIMLSSAGSRMLATSSTGIYLFLEFVNTFSRINFPALGTGYDYDQNVYTGGKSYFLKVPISGLGTVEFYEYDSSVSP